MLTARLLFKNSCTQKHAYMIIILDKVRQTKNILVSVLPILFLLQHVIIGFNRTTFYYFRIRCNVIVSSLQDNNCFLLPWCYRNTQPSNNDTVDQRSFYNTLNSYSIEYFYVRTWYLLLIDCYLFELALRTKKMEIR